MSHRSVISDVSEPDDDDPDYVLLLEFEFCRETDACLCVFFPIPVGFLQFVKACFSLGILLKLLLFLKKKTKQECSSVNRLFESDPM